MYSRVIKLTILFLLLPAVFGAGFGYALVNYLEIPDVKQLESYKPKSSTRLYSDDGTLYSELFVEKRLPIPITEMPYNLKYAFIAIEDVRFYSHFGIDVRGIGRAAFRNLMKRGISEGASTITQQLARNLYLSQQKTFKRKIEEAVLAIQIERSYSKDEILNMYLNLIYLGEGAHGVEAAAYTYFHKRAKELTLEECATLAALTKSPSRLSPFKAPTRALERRNTVLFRMQEAGFIPRNSYAKAVKTPLTVAPFRAYEKKNGYFIEYVKQMLEEYVTEPQEIYTTGLNVKTTVNLKMTEYAYEAIQKGVELYKNRNPGAKEIPEVAVIAIEVKTGELKVLIGGKDFSTSPFNRAVQAKRQPGSSFKPIIYLAALEKGFKPDTILRDGPLSFTNPYTHTVWSPRNYKNQYMGDVTMRRALEASLNTATVRLLEKTGLDNVIDLAKRLHIDANFQPNLSLALGTTEIAPLDLANAYAAIARGGIYMPPVAVKRVATTEGEEKYVEEVHGEVVVAPEVALSLVDIMKGVVKRGTARAAAGMPYSLAGKTGTTDEFRDAWFIGFSPNLLCAVWVGFDKKAYLGNKESGGTAALPIWIEFMSKALTLYPNEDFSFLPEQAKGSQNETQP
ncbi:MAG TPA: PBP1A family penicillin-binding protein [Syntrophorhabdaceae bacterium]